MEYGIFVEGKEETIIPIILLFYWTFKKYIKRILQQGVEP